MNSKVPQQATWKTADGSPWWLRSTTYSEPNGDYTANCYLDLWRTPTSPDTVQWNDGSCSYHSRSYYCQPKVGSANYAGKPKPKPQPKDDEPEQSDVKGGAFKYIKVKKGYPQNAMVASYCPAGTKHTRHACGT